MSWCTIESDPGVFNEMLTNLGVKDVAVEEIYSLEETEQQREPSYGLIFLFKWKDETDSRPFVDPSNVPDLFFARQVVQNACATQALLSVILNTPDVDIGDELREFKLFTSELDSESRGFAIGGCDKIRITHNSFARAEPFFIEELRQSKGDKEDVYHFVAYIPFHGKVYEIDGLRGGPVILGDVTGDWLAVAKPAIEQRMLRYAATETHFALLSIRPKRSSLLESELATLQTVLDALTTEDEASNAEEIENIRTQMIELRSKLDDELATLERQHQENLRRRHNYVPFIVSLLKVLSQKGHLNDLVTKAKEKKRNSSQNGRKGTVAN